MIRTAPEGRWFIVAAFAILLIMFLTLDWWWGLLWLPIAIWVVAFFRDPTRSGERGEQMLIAPADGKVVSVLRMAEPAFIQGESTRVSIFMNVFDCHVNRYPSSGTVEYRHYNPGLFVNAAAEKASLENEQSSIGLLTAHGKILVRQIAGLVARRIVTDHAEGHKATQGERMGMIRFGSRVDVFMPPKAEVLVKDGDRTVAGVTVIARWA